MIDTQPRDNKAETSNTKAKTNDTNQILLLSAVQYLSLSR